MFKDDASFPKPDDENVLLWRYMDFEKYVSLLDTRALFFARADKLGDSFEGSVSKANIERRSRRYSSKTGLARHVPAIVSGIAEANPRFTCINCWHMSEHESAAMWKLYAGSGKGVAVQSTYKRLRASMADAERTIYPGLVTYIDYVKEPLPVGGILGPFMCKRKSFEYEKEFRAVVLVRPSGAPGQPVDLSVDVVKDGIPVSVDVEELVEAVFVAPSSSDGYERVRSVNAKYGFDVDVSQSSLDDLPVY